MKKQGGYKAIFILALISAGFFYGQKSGAEEHIDRLVINEVYYDPAETAETGKEWIELYNGTANPIELIGYDLNATPGDYYTLPNFTLGSGNFVVVHWRADGTNTATDLYTGISGFDVNMGDTNGWVALFNNIIHSKNTIIDYVEYGAGGKTWESIAVAAGIWTAGDYMVDVDKGHSLARKLVGFDTNQSSDFEDLASPNPQSSGGVVTPPPTGQCGNGQVESGEQCDDGNLASGDGCSSTCQAETAISTPPVEQPVISEDTATSTGSTSPPVNKNNFGDVLINELVYDPADNEVEWIELYNKVYREIDLTGWWLEEGGKAKTVLSGNLGASGAGRYKIIDKPAGSLNNGGDIIILYDASGKTIDQVAYGDWNDGNRGDNAPAAADPLSLARKFDGFNTYDNLNDFTATLKPTKGAGNIIQIEDEISLEARAKFDFSSDIFISEILPNPAGDDAKLEFMEIYNAGKREVNLTGWSLSNEDNKKVNLEKIATSTIIKAGEYLAFFRPRAKIVLHNDQGQVKLFEPLADKPLAIVDYKSVKEGWSYNSVDFKIKGEWVWSETATPGAMNIFKAINHPPEAEFSFSKETLAGRPVIFDSSDTNDQDGDSLKFNWDFGDGLKNSLANPEHTYLKSGVYKVKLEVGDGQGTSTKEKSVKVLNSFEEMDDVSEIAALPAAARNDSIIINEIFPNPAGADTGEEWLEIKNQSQAEINLLNWRVENSNGKYKFNNAEPLEAGIFYLLDNTVSRLAFKNTDDTIRLYNDLDELVDQVEYASAVQGEAYARGANGNWFWTTELTPGQENIISLAGSKSEILTKMPEIAGASGHIETTLEKIKELDVGSLVKVKGTVAVEPGILGAQIFYIVGSPGMQIYNYKKDFPALKAGDYVEISGELSQAQGEFRIKTKDKNDIKLIERKASPVALAVKGDEVSEENIGQLITITGEITDKKSASLYIDDGSDEVFIYIKQNTGINTKGLEAGQRISATGILSKTQTGLRLLPRYQEDIVLINSADGLEPQVLGEAIEAEEWNLAERDKKLELFKYLLIIAGGVIILLAGLFIKAKRKV